MISFRSGNPALGSKTFKMDKAADQGVMTLQGTVNKTAISLFLAQSYKYRFFQAVL